MFILVILNINYFSRLTVSPKVTILGLLYLRYTSPDLPRPIRSRCEWNARWKDWCSFLGGSWVFHDSVNMLFVQGVLGYSNPLPTHLHLPRLHASVRAALGGKLVSSCCWGLTILISGRNGPAYNCLWGTSLYGVHQVISPTCLYRAVREILRLIFIIHWSVPDGETSRSGFNKLCVSG